jgi:regulator of protease activity HflC (stomatin/prohibitin superfamily)
MRADYLTYQRATSVAVQGLVLQALTAAGLFSYGLIAHDHPAITIAWYVAAGVLVWLSLLIVYDQHRRERIEAIEVEAMAKTPLAGTSVFEGQDEFRPAARRLAGLHKYFVPAMSLLIAAILIAVGLWRFFGSGRELVAPDQFSPSRSMGWGLGVGLLAAVTGFLMARYAAGMAKQPAWAMLRAGAAAAVGSSLMGLVLAIGHFVDFIGPDTLSRLLVVIAPIVVLILAGEIVLNFVLGAYRPRKAGEMPRPAFESRLLSFAAAPDRVAQSISEAINYQLGFDVTGGWFYQLLRRTLVFLVAAFIVVLVSLSCVAIVEPHQRALVLRFGAPIREVGPGLTFKAPWPIDTLYIPEYYTRDARGRMRIADYTATGVRTLNLATQPPATTEPILWTNDHLGEEIYQYVRAGTGAAGELADLAVVSAELPLSYVVEDIRKFEEIAPPQIRDDLLTGVARREIRAFFQTLTLDQVLGGSRKDLSGQLQDRIQKAFDSIPSSAGSPLGAGVRVVSVKLSGVHPPKETAAAFETPVQADQNLKANVEAAETDAIKSLAATAGDVALARSVIGELDALDRLATAKSAPSAITEQEIKIQRLIESGGGSAATLLSQARAERWKAHMSARGASARFAGQRALYEASSDVFKLRMYFEALAEAMRRSRVYIVADPEHTRVDIDLTDKDFGTDMFREISAGSSPDGSGR